MTVLVFRWTECATLVDVRVEMLRSNFKYNLLGSFKAASEISRAWNCEKKEPAALASQLSSVFVRLG
ncbi:unnamed protein product [Calypogeia fissa]